RMDGAVLLHHVLAEVRLPGRNGTGDSEDKRHVDSSSRTRVSSLRATAGWSAGAGADYKRRSAWPSGWRAQEEEFMTSEERRTELRRRFRRFARTEAVPQSSSLYERLCDVVAGDDM